jgi:glutamine synthetase type III
MRKSRAVADQMELLTGKQHWPFPTFSDLLFSV